MIRLAAVAITLCGGCGARSSARPLRPSELEGVLQEGISAAIAGDVEGARRRLEAVIEADPDGMSGAIAWDALRDLAGRRLLVATPPTCPEAAAEAYAEAERRWYEGRAVDAVEYYERAVAGCPDNALYWVHFGDVVFKLGDHRRASELYLEGLKRQPWERSAYRFLADAEMRLGRIDSARQAAVLAVVSDPTYEAGWATLRTVTVSMGGLLKRVRAYKPEVSFEPDGRPKITVRNPPGSDSRGDTTAWLTYALIEYRQKSYDRGLPVVPSAESAVKAEPPPASSLDRELERVEEAIAIHGRLVADDPDQVSRFWQMMTEAKERGFLTEAVFLHLLDEASVDEYVRFRERDSRRLVEYMDQLVAPVPSEPRVPQVL